MSFFKDKPQPPGREGELALARREAERAVIQPEEALTEKEIAEISNLTEHATSMTQAIVNLREVLNGYEDNPQGITGIDVLDAIEKLEQTMQNFTNDGTDTSFTSRQYVEAYNFANECVNTAYVLINKANNRS